ncbi:hypothetical protein [Nocardia seriolae]|nr:hypothetical protein [Nocardia seriolae]MTJ63028.1 hypothetical protein [Nocardia seriolae]MTJ74913.1 hypothetical protein [Nocardia seriolae]MTJ88053.1 hypothetical protein [Nocardia seriolae]MTK32043.1 hypothetical protein [Nocardia seriolae]MTK42057.1 hypothetical protein [Nocardia seriolae]
MSTVAVVVIVISGVAGAAGLCAGALLIAIRWTRAHPDRQARRGRRAGL